MFRTIFLILAKEFESVETSSGFARQVSTLHTYLWFFFVKTQHSVLNFSQFTIFCFKIINTSAILLKKSESEQKNPKNLQCALCTQCSAGPEVEIVGRFSNTIIISMTRRWI